MFNEFLYSDLCTFPAHQNYQHHQHSLVRFSITFAECMRSLFQWFNTYQSLLAALLYFVLYCTGPGKQGSFPLNEQTPVACSSGWLNLPFTCNDDNTDSFRSIRRWCTGWPLAGQANPACHLRRATGAECSSDSYLQTASHSNTNHTNTDTTTGNECICVSVFLLSCEGF